MGSGKCPPIFMTIHVYLLSFVHFSTHVCSPAWRCPRSGGRIVAPVASDFRLITKCVGAGEEEERGGEEGGGQTGEKARV